MKDPQEYFKKYLDFLREKNLTLPNPKAAQSRLFCAIISLINQQLTPNSRAELATGQATDNQ